MFNDSFDARSVQPQQGFSVHPNGMFDAQLTHTFLKPTADQQGLMFRVEFTTPAGRIEKGYNVYNKSPQAMEIANKELSALCHAVGIYKITYPKDPTGNPIMDQAGRELRQARCRIEVGPQTRKNADTGKFEETGYAEIIKVFDTAGNEPGKTPAQPSAQGQPMQQNGQGNWTQPAQQPAPQSNNWDTAKQQQPQQESAQQPAGGAEKPPWAR